MIQPDDEKLVTRYLLGDLSEAERTAVEERFFADDEFYDFMRAVQEEMADDYARGDLSRRDRRLFEKSYLTSPARRRHVAFATALAAALDQTSTVKTPARRAAPWWQPVAAFLQARTGGLALAMAAALALMFGIGWLVVENRRLDRSLEQARGERDAAAEQARAGEAEAVRRRQELEREIAELRARGEATAGQLRDKERELERLKQEQRRATPPAESLASFVLLPGIVRDGNNPGDEPSKLVIPPAARAIRLQLDLERDEPYQRYRAEVRVGGRLVWSQDGLAARATGYGQAVFLRLPAGVLAQGEYEVALRGAVGPGRFEDVGYYYFIPIKK